MQLHTLIADRCEILDGSAQDGMGIVYKGQNRLTGQMVAIKALWVDDAQLKIIHRDLKPGNILLRQDGTPLLADNDPKALLLNHLRSRQMLLVMDNLEHLLAGAPLVTEMLSSAPGLRVLATPPRAAQPSGGNSLLDQRTASFPVDAEAGEQPDLYEIAARALEASL